MRLHYNSPVVLTFVLVAVTVHLVNIYVLPEFTSSFFAADSSFSPTELLDYFRLVSHTVGHIDFQHLFNNVLLLLLLGPILEEKYGSRSILLMMLLTAFLTGMLNVLLFSTSLLGASGIVFMFIVLISIVNMRNGSIPLSFILVFCIYVGSELMQILEADDISRMAHIVGGLMGAVFGFIAKPSVHSV